jgi:tetratricopeptide (TPR) repeat protein
VAGVEAAFVSILVAIFVGLVTFVGISGFRQFSRAKNELNQSIQRLEQESARNKHQVDLLASQLREANETAIKNIESRVSFYRYFLLGELCYNSSDFGGALTYFRKAAAFNHSASEVQYFIARCLTYRNEIEEAVGLLEELRKSDYDSPSVLRALALAGGSRNPKSRSNC